MDILERFFVLVGIWEGVKEHSVAFMLWYTDELQQLFVANIDK